MVTLCNRADHIYLHPVLCSFFFFPCLISAPQRSEIGCLPYFHTHTWCGLSANLGCRCETCCTRLAGNAGRKKIAKKSPSAHYRTTSSGYRISSQLRHVSTIGKKLVKQQYLLQMFPQYGELWHTSS